MTAAASPELVDQQAVRRAGGAVLGMAIFVASEAVFFGAFFGIYMTAYTSARVWPPAGASGPPLLLPSIAVGAVLLSGATMGVTVRGLRRPGFGRGSLAWLGATLVLSLVFSVLLVLGYSEVGFGIGQGIYQSLFYVITGLELAHAVGGVALLALVLVRGLSGELALHRDPVLAAGIYWYFVVAIGVVIYLVLYVATAG